MKEFPSILNNIEVNYYNNQRQEAIQKDFEGLSIRLSLISMGCCPHDLKSKPIDCQQCKNLLSGVIHD
jgi:hypothetical protein